MSKPSNPQQKKILSYVKDRVESYGESRSSAAKSINRRKQLANSSYRKAQNQVLRGLQNIAVNAEIVERATLVVESVSRKEGHAQWRKVPAQAMLFHRDHTKNRVWTYQRSSEPSERAYDSELAHAARLMLKKRGY